MPKTKKAAKTSKSPKAKHPPRAKVSKKTASASKTIAKPKIKNSDEQLYKAFTTSLDNLITHWQKEAQKKSKTDNGESTQAQANANKYNLLKQMIADFENSWQQKPAATPTLEKIKQDESIQNKKPVPLSKRAAPADWEEDMENLSEFGEDEMAENLDDIFLPLDEDELSFEGDDYSSDMMDDDN